MSLIRLKICFKDEHKKPDDGYAYFMEQLKEKFPVILKNVIYELKRHKGYSIRTVDNAVMKLDVGDFIFSAALENVEIKPPNKFIMFLGNLCKR